MKGTTQNDIQLLAALEHHDPLLMHNLGFFLVSKLLKIKILVPLEGLVRLLGQKEVVSKFLVLEGSIDPSDNHPQVYLGMNKVDEPPPPFYISLMVNGLLLLHYMLDSGASTNVMTLEVMNE